MEYFKDSIDFKNLSPEQKKHVKEILKKEVEFLEIVLKRTSVPKRDNGLNHSHGI